MNLNTVIINTYRESARAGQRGLKKLQRKVYAHRNRVDFLENFLKLRQMDGELQAVELRIKQERLGAWVSRDITHFEEV